MNTLLLRLEGPLQSWGLRARWEERDSASEPTKSGVIGLLGCALGLRRDDDRLRQLSEALRMGVRVDRAGSLLVDYHTTGGGYLKASEEVKGTRFADEPYVGGVLSTDAPNKRGRYQVKITQTSKTPETDVSKRAYLMDAAFLVALQGGDAALIAELAVAVQAPVWPYYLGRKACVPSAPVFAGTGDYADLQAALVDQPLPTPPPESFRLLLEADVGSGTLRNDNIGVPARRIFWPRVVAERYWTPAGGDAPINTMEG